MRVVGGVDLAVAQEVAVFIGWWAWGGVEGGLVGDAGDDGLLHRVVDFEDPVFGSVVAVGGFVFAFDDGECFHDEGHGVAGGGERFFEGGKLFGRFVADGSISNTSGLPSALFVGGQVEVEERGIKFATNLKPPLFIPTKRRAIPATVIRKLSEIPSSKG